MRIIPRAEWGARHDNGTGKRVLPAKEAWLHHSVTIAPDIIPPFDDDYQAVRDLEQIGEDRFGSGISYTWLITPAGLIFEGHSVDRIGTHTQNHNTVACGICYIGDYTHLQPTPSQLSATAWLLQEAHRNRWLAAARLNGGHRDLKATACPGDQAYPQIGHINQLAAGPSITEEVPDMDATQAQQLKSLHDWFEAYMHAMGEVGGGKIERNRHDYETQGLVRALATLGVSPGQSGTVTPGTALPNPVPEIGAALPFIELITGMADAIQELSDKVDTLLGAGSGQSVTR